MTHIFPSSFHQKLCLYISVAISAEMIIRIHSSIFRHAVFCKKREHPACKECSEESLAAWGLALGTAGAFRGSRPPRAELATFSLCLPCAGAQDSVPAAAPASQGGGHEVRPAIVMGIQEAPVAIPTFSAPYGEDHWGFCFLTFESPIHKAVKHSFVRSWFSAPQCQDCPVSWLIWGCHGSLSLLLMHSHLQE